MKIWFLGGGLPGLDVQTFSPVFLRGYDTAGNLLHTVRLNDVYPHEFATSEERAALENTQAMYFSSALTQSGESITVTYSGSYPPVMQPVARAAVDSAGRVYCAMDAISLLRLKPGVTTEQVWAGKLSDWRDYPYWPPDVFSDLLYLSSLTLEYHERKFVDFFRVYRQNGDRIHDFPSVHGAAVSAVAVDSSDAFYIAGEPDGVDGIYLRKFNQAGAQQWEAGLGRWWTDVTPFDQYSFAGVTYTTIKIQWYDINLLVDSAGNVFVSGHRNIITPTSAYTPTAVSHDSAWLRKYNSSGVLQWERRFPVNGLSNLVTDGTYFYIAHHGVLYSKTGHPITQYQIGETAYFFMGDESPIDISVWDTDGDLIDAVATPVNENYGIHRLAIYDGNLYCSSYWYTEGYTDSPAMYIFDTATLAAQPLNLTAQQYRASISAASGQRIPRFVFGADGSQYFTGVESKGGEYHFVAYSGAGAVTWTGISALGDTTGLTESEKTYPAQWFCTDVFSQPSPQLPALRLDIALGIPSWLGDHYTAIPGLALPIALGLPKFWRDYVGAPRPEIYRVRLTGSPDIELPAAWISVRHTTGQRALSISCSAPSLATVEAIDARSGGDLVLLRGVRFGPGDEQLDEMMRAPLQSVRMDRGSHSLTVTLSGVNSDAVDVASPRTAKGVSYRAVNSGLRRARCQPDTYLTLGTLIDLGGGELMTVGEITITISPSSGIMEVAEISA